MPSIGLRCGFASGTFAANGPGPHAEAQQALALVPLVP